MMAMGSACLCTLLLAFPPNYFEMSFLWELL